MKYKITKLLCFLMIFGGGQIYSGTAHAGMNIPECPVLEEWVSEVPHSHLGKSDRKSKIEQLFTDEKIIPVFGVSFFRWSAIESDLVYDRLATCAREADQRGDNRANSRLEQVSEQFKRAQRLKRTGFKEPECIFVYQWIHRGSRLPENLTGKISDEMKNKILFSDSHIVPLFGLSYEDWRRDDKKKAREILQRCMIRMSKKSDENIAIGLQNAMYYIQ